MCTERRNERTDDPVEAPTTSYMWASWANELRFVYTHIFGCILGKYDSRCFFQPLLLSLSLSLSLAICLAICLALCLALCLVLILLLLGLFAIVFFLRTFSAPSLLLFPLASFSSSSSVFFLLLLHVFLQ
jgi:hypothetical protein